VVITKKKVKKIALLSANVLLILGLGFTSGFYYLRYSNEKNKNLTTEQRIDKYEKEISKTFTLPKGERPKIADVNLADETKKIDKEFFKSVENNDILLIYEKAPLIVVYRPSTKKIINSGQVSFKQQLTVAIIGAKSDRNTVVSVLNQAFSKDIAKATESDPKSPLEAGKTIVVDLTGKNAELATKLATELKGSVGNVPEGQDKPGDGPGIAIYAAPSVTPGL